MNVTTLTAIHATESLVQLSLDAQRNNLIIFDLQATLGSLSIAGVTLVTSIFGMNLLHGLEQSPGIFSLVTMSSIGIGSALFVAGLRKVRRIRSDSIGTGTLVLKDYKRIINGS